MAHALGSSARRSATFAVSADGDGAHLPWIRGARKRAARLPTGALRDRIRVASPSDREKYTHRNRVFDAVSPRGSGAARGENPRALGDLHRGDAALTQYRIILVYHKSLIFFANPLSRKILHR
jgi:hypothetical protein